MYSLVLIFLLTVLKDAYITENHRFNLIFKQVVEMIWDLLTVFWTHMQGHQM